jgi:hypothetical protein
VEEEWKRRKEGRYLCDKSSSESESESVVRMCLWSVANEAAALSNK